MRQLTFLSLTLSHHFVHIIFVIILHTHVRTRGERCAGDEPRMGSLSRARHFYLTDDRRTNAGSADTILAPSAAPTDTRERKEETEEDTRTPLQSHWLEETVFLED